MADIRINALATTAASTASDDFIAVDGSANGTRKLNAYSPTFGGNLTVSGSGTSSAGSINVANPSTTGDANYATLLAASQPTSTTNWFNIGVAPAPYNWAALGFYYAGSGSASNALVFARYGAELGRWTFDKTLTVGGNLTVSGTGTSSFSGRVRTTSNDGFDAIVSSGNTGLGLGSGSQQYSLYLNAADNSLRIYSSPGGDRLAVSSGGNFLVGTTTDSANGKVQLATHTTSAGGIGFGTDTSLYRSAAYTLKLDGGNNVTSFRVLGSGSCEALMAVTSASSILFGSTTAGASTLICSGNGTTALTLDSSQNATFAGNATIGGANGNLTIKGTGGTASNLNADNNLNINVNYSGSSKTIAISTAGSVTLPSGAALQLGNAYVASAVVPTGYVTIKDSNGTTYKVCVLL